MYIIINSNSALTLRAIPSAATTATTATKNYLAVIIIYY